MVALINNSIEEVSSSSSNTNTHNDHNHHQHLHHHQNHQPQQPQSIISGCNNNNSGVAVVAASGRTDEPQQPLDINIQQVISNFKMRPLQVYQQEQERMRNIPIVSSPLSSMPFGFVSSPNNTNNNTTSNPTQQQHSFPRSPLNYTANPFTNSSTTVIIPSNNTNNTISHSHHSLNQSPLHHQENVVQQQQSIIYQAIDLSTPTAYSNSEDNIQQGLLMAVGASSDRSSSSSKNTCLNGSLKSYVKAGLLVFHLICQCIMSIMILSSFFFYNWKSMIVFTPKIVIGFLIILAVYKKKNGFLHFLLGSVLLDLIYTTILVSLRFYVTAKPGEASSVLESTSTDVSSLMTTNTNHHNYLKPSILTTYNVNDVKLLTNYNSEAMTTFGNNQIDMQGTSASTETQKKKLPGLWFQLGIQIMGGLIVGLTIVWTLIVDNNPNS